LSDIQLFTAVTSLSGVGLVLIGSGIVWLWFYVVGEAVLKRLSRDE